MAIKPKSIKDVVSLIEAEKEDRENALISQEHRLFSAIRNFVSLILEDDAERRKRLLPGAATALFWCLIPSAGTATVGFVAIASLVLAWQQSRLLAVQNDKIEVQNVLAEAQRRAGLVFEITAIFEQIEKEKGATKIDDPEYHCSEERKEACYTRFQDPSEQVIFTPSRATLGRIAALTQALRPYRYLVVEGSTADLCPSDTRSINLDAAYNFLVGELANRGPRGGKAPIDVDRAKELAEDAYARNWGLPLDSSRNIVSSTLNEISDWVLGLKSPANLQLNCSPASPERGQLLVSLHAAGIDISAIQAAGGDFTYSDIPGASLSGVRLDGVNLTGARLPGANFGNSLLHNVIFRDADLSNARFTNAWISKSDFEGAQIQVYLRDGDAPLFLMPSKSEDNLLSGFRLYQRSSEPNIIERFCYSITLPTGLAAEAKKLALLVETRKYRSNGKPSVQYARLMFDIGIPLTTLGSKELTDQEVELEYSPISACRDTND